MTVTKHCMCSYELFESEGCSYREVIKLDNLKIAKSFLTIVRAQVISECMVLNCVPGHGDLVMKCSDTCKQILRS